MRMLLAMGVLVMVLSGAALAQSGLLLLHAGSAGGAAAPIGGALLLEDNASFLLLEDNLSHLCFEGAAC